MQKTALVVRLHVFDRFQNQVQPFDFHVSVGQTCQNKVVAPLVSWTTDDLALSPSPVRHHVRPDPFGGSMKRCQRCDIPLGARPCPNLQCGEQHGQSAGDLCAWCRQNHEERMDVINFAHLYDIAPEVLQRASARLG
jgi:hypothetical protein